MEGMASGASSLDSAGSSDGPIDVERDSGGCDSVESPVGDPECQDYDDLQTQYQLLRHKHSDTIRRCEHTMKELEYYRSQHIAAMSQGTDGSGQEPGNQQRGVSSKGTKDIAELDSQATVNDNLNQHYLSAVREYGAARDEYESLRKRYDDLISTHTSVVKQLELTQEEAARLKKQYDDLVQECNVTARERNGLKQQCTAAIRQWDIALRERNEYREALAKLSQQHEEAVKEINQAMIGRMKASKDLKRLTEERNAALHEYSLIMSERDTVHQEMETLGNDLSQAYAKVTHLENENKQLIEEKKTLSYQIETLRREISSALHDRDEALKECNELRQKFGEAYSEASNRDRKNRLELHSYSTERDVANKEAEKESSPRDYKRDKERLDNLDQANIELDKLRKLADKLHSELEEALQEAEVSKRRRDWAFSERDKIVLERESIRSLCDRLRKERDRAVSDLANALRDSDDIKKQRNEASKELKDLKEKIESGDHSIRSGQFHDSDSDWDTVQVHVDLNLVDEHDLGLMLVGGRDNPYYPDDSGVYVAQIAPGSAIENKLRVNDCIIRVNNVDCASTRAIIDTLRGCNSGSATLTIRRRRMGRRSLRTTQLPVGSVPHGIMLEIGIYIAKISPGSSAAKDGCLAVGDRVLNINSKSMEGITSADEAMSILEDTSSDVLTITTLKSFPLAASSSADTLPLDGSFSPEKQKMVNSCSQTEQERMMLKTTSDDYDRRYIAPNIGDRSVYKVSKSLSSDKPSGISGAWDNFREKIDMVRGRRHSKDRDDKKKRHRNSSPNTFEQEQDAIAKLDSVIESYKKSSNGSSGNNGVLKRSKRRGVGSNGATSGTATIAAASGIGISGAVNVSSSSTHSDKSAIEKNGGTWPKTRIGPLIQNGTGTILHPRKVKERLPLSILVGNQPKYPIEAPPKYPIDAPPKYPIEAPPKYPIESPTKHSMEPMNSYAYNRISQPIPLSSLGSSSVHSNRHTVYKTVETPLWGKLGPLHAPPKSFVPSAVHFNIVEKSNENSGGMNSPLAPSETSIDLSVKSVDFYSNKNKRINNKHLPIEDFHSRAYTHVFIPPGAHRVNQIPNHPAPPYPIPPIHPHQPQLQAMSSRYPSPPLANAQSGESIGLPDARSFSFEPPYVTQSPVNFTHVHTPSIDVPYHKPKAAHTSISGYVEVPPPYVGQGWEGGTFPRKKESQRFRIPSNPNVVSKTSVAKLSSGSIEKTSERGSPLPTFQIEVLGPGPNAGTTIISPRLVGANKRVSVHEYGYIPHIPTPGQVRRIYIDKSQDPLGIQITCVPNGGVFVSSVTDHSLASHVGLQIGDQLLDVCGINMRTCGSYEVAANILRQCGNSFTMLVQYLPDKYTELENSASSDNSDTEGGNKAPSHSGSSTACNTPEESHKNSTIVETLENSEPERDTQPPSIPQIRAPKERERDRERDRELRASASLDVRTTQDREREMRNSTSLDINIRKPELRQSVTLDGLRTLTRGQLSQGGASTLQRQNATVRSPTQEDQSKTPPPPEPRYLFIETRKCSNLGISLVGGNGVGIFVHSVQPGCLAEEAGLHTGDRILEYNGVDLRQATAEQAALELARPADKVTLIAQYVPDRYNEVKDKPGDSFYVKAMFDRTSEPGDALQLKFNKDDILYVDNTMFNGTPGHWRAWLVDQTGRRQTCGIIPSKFKVEEEMLLRRSLGDLESDPGGSRRGTTSARRSFFRRKKHQRSSSRDSKELSQLTGINMGWYSDSGTLNEENMPLSYQRVERLDYPSLRPIIIIGPLNECVSTKLLQEYPGEFIKCIPEAMHCSQSTLEQGLRDSLYVDYRKKGSYFECTTVQAVKDICEKNSHCILDISLASLERLHRHQIYPIVILIKFKSTKQIKEVKDSRYPSDKVSAKAAKEMYEHALKVETEYRQFINVVIPAGGNIAIICSQVKTSVDEEQSKALWVPRGLA